MKGVKGSVTGNLAFPEGCSRVDLGLRRSRWKVSGFGEALTLLCSGSAGPCYFYVQVRRSLDTIASGFGDADTSSEIPWISRKDKKEGRSLHEKGIFQILVYLIQVIYAVELSLFWRFICEIYNSLNSLLRPHSSVTCPSSSRDRPPYRYRRNRYRAAFSDHGTIRS